jgi:hypothetical protein
MAEEAIPSAADPLQSRVPPTRLPSLAELYAAQQLGQSLPSNSYTLPELYALEQTGAPLDASLDVAPSPDTSSPQKSQSPGPQAQSLPILADQSGAPLQPEPLTPGERLAGTARAAAQGLTGDRSDYAEALGRGLLGWQPQSIQARRSAEDAFREGKPGKVQSQESASLDDHLADIHAAAQRFHNFYPTEEAEAQGIGIVGPALLGLSATGLLARMAAGERLAATSVARPAPQVFTPLARRVGPELAEGAPATASAAATAEPSVGSAATEVERGTIPAAAKTDPVTSLGLAEAQSEPDVAFQTYLLRKDKGSGRKRHIREANENYLRATENDPGLALSMSKLGIKIERTPRGKVPWKPPEGWTWHHHPHDPGLMQLMPRSQHESPLFQAILHPFKYGGGGYKKWGNYYSHIPGAAAGGIWLMQHPDAEPEGEPQQPEYD